MAIHDGVNDWCALRTLAGTLIERLGPVGQRALQGTSQVTVDAWVRDARWSVEEAGLRAAHGGAVMHVMIPGVLLCENPPVFTVTCAGPGGNVTLLVNGPVCSVQETLPW